MMDERVNLDSSGEQNSYGYWMAKCVAIHPDDPDQTPYPCTLNGTDLDSWCNQVDSAMSSLLHEVTELGANHSTGYAFNPGAIPSESQRRAFVLMRDLMGQVYSLAGTLRYDVGADHTDCPEHDTHVMRNVERILTHYKEYTP